MGSELQEMARAYVGLQREEMQQMDFLYVFLG